MKLLYYTTQDIMKMFSCSVNIAQRILREIKAYQDKLKVKGKILVSDFEDWYNAKEEQK